MIQSLLMLSGLGQPVQSPIVQATLNQPPASASRGTTGKTRLTDESPGRFKFMVIVAGNAAGFAGLMAGCWLGVQLLQSVLALTAA